MDLAVFFRSEINLRSEKKLPSPFQRKDFQQNYLKQSCQVMRVAGIKRSNTSYPLVTLSVSRSVWFPSVSGEWSRVCQRLPRLSGIPGVPLHPIH